MWDGPVLNPPPSPRGPERCLDPRASRSAFSTAVKKRTHILSQQSHVSVFAVVIICREAAWTHCALFLQSFGSSLILIHLDTRSLNWSPMSIFQSAWDVNDESAGETPPPPPTRLHRCLYWTLYFVIRSILVTGTECTDMCMYFMLTVSHLLFSLDHNRQSSVLVRQSFTETFGIAANYLFVNK